MTLTYLYFQHIAAFHAKNFNTFVMILVLVIFITHWKSMKSPPMHLSHGQSQQGHGGPNHNHCGQSNGHGNGNTASQTGSSLADKIITSEILYNSQNSTQYAGLKFKFCTTCLTDRSLASIHCSKCNLCVVDLDHHCPFVCNCVGRGNRRVFVFFTLLASLGCLLVAVTTFMAEYDHFCIEEGKMSYSFYYVQKCMLVTHPSLLIGSWLGLNCFIWIFSIFWGQMSMIGAETTTYEVIRKHNYGRDCMTMRSLRNIWLFLRTGVYTVSDSSDDNHVNGHGDEESVPLLVTEMRQKEKERDRESRDWESNKSNKMNGGTTSGSSAVAFSMMRSKSGTDPMQIV
jgi:hypothetical protein